MEFDRKFFEDEVREGFFVSSAMKHSWAAQLEVLEEIATVCQNHGIEWFIDFGTLLGAVRHGGFIPWDDDIDITMTRPNYEKFLEVSRAELPSFYSVLNMRFEPEYDEVETRVSSGRGIDFSEARLEKYHGSPLSDGIDIFVMDYLPRDHEQAALQEDMARTVESLFNALRKSSHVTSEAAELITRVQAMTGVTFDSSRPLPQQVHMLLDNIYRLFSEEDSDMLAHMYKHFEYGAHRHIFPKEYFENIVWIPFEHIELPAPIGYDAILEMDFPGYLNIVKGSSAHNYPLYGMQEEFMLSRFPDKKIDYTFDKQDLMRPGILSNNISDNDDNDAVKDESSFGDVLFLLSHPSHWISMEPLYKRSLSEGKNARILLTSYYDKNIHNKLGVQHLEARSMPSGVDFITDETFRFDDKIYSEIYTADGVDECGRDYAVGRRFQVRELLKHSPCVTYISPYLVDDFEADDQASCYNLRFYAGIPGVVRADFTIVHSEIIRDRFIDYLTKISGAKYAPLWKQKIVVE